MGRDMDYFLRSCNGRRPASPRKFLGPPNPSAISKDPEKSKAIASEIMRGIQLTTGMKASIDEHFNWVLLECESETMAAWMHRAIVAENVFADHLGNVVRLPSGPAFRIEKEIKNVIVCVAKTWHYWDGHMSESEKAKAGKVINDAPLITPTLASTIEITAAVYAKAVIETVKTVGAALKFESKSAVEYGWVGFECPDEKSAAWFVRAIIACNILARRKMQYFFFQCSCNRIIMMLINQQMYSMQSAMYMNINLKWARCKSSLQPIF